MKFNVTFASLLLFLRLLRKLIILTISFKGNLLTALAKMADIYQTLSIKTQYFIVVEVKKLFLIELIYVHNYVSKFLQKPQVRIPKISSCSKGKMNLI